MGAEGCATKTLRGWHTSHSCLTGVGASHEDDRSLREGLAAPDLGGQQQQLVSALSMRGCELSPRRRESSSEPARWSTDGPVPPISCRSIFTLTIPVSEFPPPNGLRTPTRPGGSPASTPRSEALACALSARRFHCFVESGPRSRLFRPHRSPRRGARHLPPTATVTRPLSAGPNDVFPGHRPVDPR